MLRQIGAALSMHAAAEEAEAYPVIPRYDEHATQHARDEHDAMKRVLADLDGADPADDGVASRIAELRALVEAHVAEEEGTLLPELAAAVGTYELEQLADRFNAAKEKGPTHPHPHSPVNKVTNVVAGALDHARDALRHG